MICGTEPEFVLVKPYSTGNNICHVHEACRLCHVPEARQICVLGTATRAARAAVTGRPVKRQAAGAQARGLHPPRATLMVHSGYLRLDESSALSLSSAGTPRSHWLIVSGVIGTLWKTHLPRPRRSLPLQCPSCSIASMPSSLAPVPSSSLCQSHGYPDKRGWLTWRWGCR